MSYSIVGDNMKVLLYRGSVKYVSKSGIGQAERNQEKSLELIGIPYTKTCKDEFDVVHLNTIFLDSLIVSRWAKWKGKKVIYYAHSTMEDFRNSFRGSNYSAKIYKMWLMYCYRSGDLIVTPTDYSKNLLMNYGLKKQIICISNGVDTAFFRRNAMAGLRFREKYHLLEDAKVIISVGLFIERKGILDFIKLAETLPQYEFFWFGHTNLNLVPKNIKNAVETSLPNLHFPGFVERSALRDAFCGSDLFLFLTHEETEGLVLLEALASKTPVLIRDIDIYSEWLKNGEMVYKASDFSEFVEKINWIISGMLPDLTENGYKIALERDLKEIGNELLKLYEDLNLLE